MFPTTAVSVVAIFLLIVPGIWYELLRQRYRPGRKESVYLETGRLLLAAFLLTAMSLLFLGSMRFFAPAAVLDPRLLLIQQDYFPEHLRLAILNLFESVILSTTFAVVWLHLTAPPRVSSPIFQESAWSSAFARMPRLASRKLGLPWTGATVVEARLTDGAGVRGRLVGYSSELPLLDRELLLGRPLARADAHGAWQSIEGDWSMIVVAASQISHLLVGYESPTIETAATGTRHSAGRLGPAFRHFSIVDEPRHMYVALAAELIVIICLSMAIHYQ